MWGIRQTHTDNTPQDTISGDEMFSDAFPVKEKEDGIIYEVDGASVQVKKGVDVNIGANASSEEAAEELEEGVETHINIVYSFKLQSTNFDKKSYLTYLKGERNVQIIVVFLPMVTNQAGAQDT